MNENTIGQKRKWTLGQDDASISGVVVANGRCAYSGKPVEQVLVTSSPYPNVTVTR